jgi:hypothetical protein
VQTFEVMGATRLVVSCLDSEHAGDGRAVWATSTYLQTPAWLDESPQDWLAWLGNELLEQAYSAARSSAEAAAIAHRWGIADSPTTQLGEVSP